MNSDLKSDVSDEPERKARDGSSSVLSSGSEPSRCADKVVKQGCAAAPSDTEALPSKRSPSENPTPHGTKRLKIERRFCTYGLPKPEHYQLKLLKTYEGDSQRSSWTLDHWLEMCYQGEWFTVVGPKGTGKTSSCKELCQSVNDSQTRGCNDLAIHLELEELRPPASVPKEWQANRAWIQSWPALDEALVDLMVEKMHVQDVTTFNPVAEMTHLKQQETAGNRFVAFMKKVTTLLRNKDPDQELVLVIDGYDFLQGEGMHSLFGKLGAFFDRRDTFEPGSVVFVGRQTYRTRTIYSPPFNVVQEMLSPPSFTRKQVKELYLQHTEETKQTFEDRVFDKVLDWSGGQPLLVNIIGDLVCFTMEGRPSRGHPITCEHVDVAIDRMNQQDENLQEGPHTGGKAQALSLDSHEATIP